MVHHGFSFKANCGVAVLDDSLRVPKGRWSAGPGKGLAHLPASDSPVRSSRGVGQLPWHKRQRERRGEGNGSSRCGRSQAQQRPSR